MFGLGMPELLMFTLVVLLLFGNRIPATMRSLGLGLSQFKAGLRDGDAA